MRPPTRSCKLWSHGSFFAVLDTDSDIVMVSQVRREGMDAFCQFVLAFSLSTPLMGLKQFGCVTCVFFGPSFCDLLLRA